MKIFLFDAFIKDHDTPEEASLRDGVIKCGGSISHAGNGQEYSAYGVFDRDEDAIQFKLEYL